ncbi:hypothetical protein MSPP1_002455 [Malassezia sp. CBS 17886]|nr:hypothetical protein MSPP1_002455 [Malassezia sp. CBS 17886]
MSNRTGTRVVFGVYAVGNIPYGISEEQLINVFSEVGRVVEFRLVNDREQGKFKGYGFCEFEDTETAASAVRNLNNVDVGGRPLRLDFAEMDPMADSERRGADRRTRAGAGAGLPPMPAGLPLPPGVPATDAITQTIATLPPNQLMDILTQMKGLIVTNKEQARALLQSNPQLAYAVFHAMVMMNVVDPAVLQRVLAESGAEPRPAPAPTPAPLPARPAITAAPTPPPAAAPNLDEQQRQLLQQVLQLTPEQISVLPPDQRASILQLKAQFGH